MKNSRVFWGVLFLVLGALLLLNNFILLDLDFWILWKFWPVILILVGIAWFTKSSKFAWISFAVAASVVATMMFASAQRGCNVVTMRHGNQRVEAQELFLPMTDSAKISKLDVELGAGSFRLSDTTSHLAAVRTKSSLGRYLLLNEKRDGVNVVKLTMEDNEIHLHDGSVTNSADISLNPDVQWDMDFDVGAASVNFDFSPFIVKNVSLDAGAASIRLKFGDRTESTHATLDVGASSIVVLAPEAVGCELLSNMQLSSKRFEGFTEVGENGDYRVYRTDGFDGSAKKLYLTIDGGISSIKIERYEAGKDF